MRLQRAGVRTATIGIGAQPLTEGYFASRGMEGVDAVVSRALFNALKGAGLIDTQGFLQHRAAAAQEGIRYNLDEWRRAVRPVLESAGIGDSLVNDRSPMLQELNLAYAWHEGVTHADATTIPGFQLDATFILKWLESAGQAIVPHAMQDTPRAKFGPLSRRPAVEGDCARYGLAGRSADGGILWHEVNRTDLATYAELQGEGWAL